MIFISIKVPTWYQSGDFRPAISSLIVQINECLFLLKGPFFMFYALVQMVVVSLSTLLAASAANVKEL
jgi:hypothetical protein